MDSPGSRNSWFRQSRWYIWSPSPVQLHGTGKRFHMWLNFSFRALYWKGQFKTKPFNCITVILAFHYLPRGLGVLMVMFTGMLSLETVHSLLTVQILYIQWSDSMSSVSNVSVKLLSGTHCRCRGKNTSFERDYTNTCLKTLISLANSGWKSID